MVTYGDAMTLLLCFFVILVSMSEMKKDQRFMDVMQSIRQAFGGYQAGVGVIPENTTPTNTLIKKLLQLEIPVNTDKKGDSDEEGIHGKKIRVTSVRDGIEVVVGGRIAFERFSATLMPEARDLLGKTAERLAGYNTKILIRGHATKEALPPDSMYDDARDLSYARAKAVSDELASHGVRRVRLTLVAVGATEPLVRQAYTEKRRALNRRVEVMVTEDLIEDYAGSTLQEDLKEPPDGR